MSKMRLSDECVWLNSWNSRGIDIWKSEMSWSSLRKAKLKHGSRVSADAN